MTNSYQESPWLPFLEDKPEVGYFAYQNQWQTPNQQKYYQRQFANIQNQFLGSLGQTILAGGVPNQTFTSFLAQYPWQQAYGALTPSQRGIDLSSLAPFARWIT